MKSLFNFGPEHRHKYKFVSDAVGSVFGTGGTTQGSIDNQDPALLNQRASSTFDDGYALQQQLLQQAQTGGGPLNTIFQNQLGQANNQAASLIASQRGVNPGMAARLAGQAVGQSNQQVLGQTAQNQLGSQQLAQQANAQQQQISNGVISNQNNANANIAAANNKTNAAGVGGVLGGLGSGAVKLGGMLTSGLGAAAPAVTTAGEAIASNPEVLLAAQGGAIPYTPSHVPYTPSYAAGGPISGQSHVHAYFQGGAAKAVPAMVSPGEVYLPPSAVSKVAGGADPIKAGEKIPGKAKVKGNSYANDTVPKKLEEGGIVLPKSVMESKNPHWAAHKFVQEIMAKQGLSARRKK